jgi:hypothetical protein
VREILLIGSVSLPEADRGGAHPYAGAHSFGGDSMTEQQKEAALNQAQHLMQAGISASFSDDDVQDALKFFADAEKRFNALQSRANAKRARAWQDGLMRRKRELLVAAGL